LERRRPSAGWRICGSPRRFCRIPSHAFTSATARFVPHGSSTRTVWCAFVSTDPRAMVRVRSPARCSPFGFKIYTALMSGTREVSCPRPCWRYAISRQTFHKHPQLANLLDDHAEVRRSMSLRNWRSPGRTFVCSMLVSSDSTPVHIPTCKGGVA